MTLAVALVAVATGVVILQEHPNLVGVVLGAVGGACYILGRYTRRRVRVKSREW